MGSDVTIHNDECRLRASAVTKNKDGVTPGIVSPMRIENHRDKWNRVQAK